MVRSPRSLGIIIHSLFGKKHFSSLVKVITFFEWLLTRFLLPSGDDISVTIRHFWNSLLFTVQSLTCSPHNLRKSIKFTRTYTFRLSLLESKHTQKFLCPDTKALDYPFPRRIRKNPLSDAACHVLVSRISIQTRRPRCQTNGDSIEKKTLPS